MPNQTVNKVEFGGQTVMDITDTTADAADVIEGEVFYSKSGARSVGSLGDATQSTHGLMSANDKTKLDGISGNVYSDYSVTIETTDWTLDNNVYTYTWTHSSVTYSCLVDVLFITQPDTVLTGVLSYDKISGGLQFTSTTLPTGDLSMKVRIIDSDTTWVIQQQNAFIDLDITLQASSWSNSSPYVQTWTSDKITDTCDVKVKFLEGALAASQLYIGYEKVSGGLQFTAPTKPTVNIPVRIHIINADPTAMENLDAEMVSTDVVSGAVNVQEALEAIDGKIGTLNSLTTSAKGNTVAAVNEINSKIVPFQTAQEYTGDLNDLTGNKMVYSKATNTNNPTAHPYMVSEVGDASGNRSQFALRVSDGKPFIRAKQYGGSFTTWQELALNSKITKYSVGTYIASSGDLNNCVEPGNYDWGYSPSNAPFSNGQMQVMKSESSGRLTQFAMNTSVSRFAFRVASNNEWTSWEELALNSKMPKFTTTYIESASVSGNNDGNVDIPLPAGATSILAIFPVCAEPMTTNTTFALVSGLNLTTRKVYFRTFGNDIQKYRVRYVVSYI